MGPEHDGRPGGTGPIQVEVWTWSLDRSDADRQRLEAHLSADEHARRERFVFAKDAARYAVAHGRMREILGAALRVPPASLNFCVNAFGKPSLAPDSPDPLLRFNLSHSDGLAALALCRATDIGVDIEAVRPIEEDVAGHFFSAGECAALAALPEADRLRGFYRCWTRKEAFVKAVGHGLTIPLHSFDVELSEQAPARLIRWEADPSAPARWSLRHFEPRPGWIGAVAVPAPHVKLLMRSET